MERDRLSWTVTGFDLWIGSAYVASLNRWTWCYLVEPFGCVASLKTTRRNACCTYLLNLSNACLSFLQANKPKNCLSSVQAILGGESWKESRNWRGRQHWSVGRLRRSRWHNVEFVEYYRAFPSVPSTLLKEMHYVQRAPYNRCGRDRQYRVVSCRIVSYRIVCALFYIVL